MPDEATLDALRRAPEGPVVMLNLLKFREPEGREAYKRYGAIAATPVRESQGRIIFAGAAGPVLTGSEVAWDEMIVVRFPSAAHFLRMVQSETYAKEAAPVRAEALEATLWVAAYPYPDFEE